MNMPRYALSPDIDEQIMAALAQIFAAELIAQVAVSDPLKLFTLKPYPLQDDPTLTAPYLVYTASYKAGIDPITQGHLAQIYGDVEIGGPIRFLHHYTATCGTPFQVTREACFSQINNLVTRVSEVLIRHFDLSGILENDAITSADGSKAIEGANQYLIDKIDSRIKGGEQTWFGEATIDWHYPVSWFLQVF